jgi:hypothetical protein
MSPGPILRTCAAGALVALSAACAHTRVTRFDPNFHPVQRTMASEIRFYGAARPRCPYEEIGRVSAESRLFVSWDRVVKAARKAAYDLGGDAIISVQDDTRLSGATVTPAGVTVEEKSSLSGTVIRFKHVDCME